MPQYSFRCRNCGTEFDRHFASVKQYSDAQDAAALHCPQCDSTDLSRVIRSVSVQASQPDYNRMSSSEMLTVLESGDSSAVEKMYRDVGASTPDQALPYRQQFEQQQRAGNSPSASSDTAKPGPTDKPAGKPAD